MTGYSRQSLADIQDGQDVIAEPINREYNAIQVAFNGTTGHTHDGGTGNGPKISLTSSVMGVLPAANGGTGGVLPVAQGGTGGTTPDTAAVGLQVLSQKDQAGTGAVGGTANAITLTIDRVYPVITTVTPNTAYVNTFVVAFKAVSSITDGGVTINVNGYGVVPLHKIIQSGEALLRVGDINAGGIYTIRYDTTANLGTGAFILLNASSSAYVVGDFFDTVRTLDSTWLRRDGSLYTSTSYPVLAALLPALPDGVNWTTNTSFTTGNIVQIINYSGGYIAAVSSNPNSTIWTSPDGTNWSLQSTISAFSIQSLTTNGSGIYLAADSNGKASVSNDLITWSAPALIGTSIDFYFVAYGAGVFVAVGGNTSAVGKAYTSTNGTTWTSRTVPTTSTYNGVRFVNSRFVALGTGGTILNSLDGITWNTSTAGSGSFTNVIYGNNLYVAVGIGGILYTSPNLTAWTSRASTTTNSLNDINYSTAGFIAVGNSGTSIISPAGSGTTWTSIATGTSQTLYTVAIDTTAPQKYYVGGTSGIELKGVRTLPTQFQVPNDAPQYGWIKAL